MIGYSAESAKNIFPNLQLIARTVDSTMDDVMEMLEKDKLSQHLGKAQMTLFLDLYQDMHNHTRMQCNRGHTPAEISAMMPRGKGALQSISLGQNIRDSLKDGTLNMLHPGDISDYSKDMFSKITLLLMNDSFTSDLSRS
ncbi:MAG: hypothetical protein J6I45_12640 [Clostridia bacterium]|nr:hypothetical protein [Clostridia bacterium]